MPIITTRSLGPGLLFERLWRETGCQATIQRLLQDRRFEFPVERALFLTVVHRLLQPGSDRAADSWRADYVLDGCEPLQFHHLYRAMGWLGEALDEEEQSGRTPFAPRCVKDQIEEGLFARRRELFTPLDAALREKLRQGDKALIGNKGFRRYVRNVDATHFAINEAKLAEEARYDGKWVLRTNTELTSDEVALQYKRLWMVEHWFRSCKSLLETRPIFHKCDATIRGHVFCSFLALVLRQELETRLAARNEEWEWGQVIQDVDRLRIVEVEHEGKRFLLRSEALGSCGKVFQAAGVALPPTVRQVESEPADKQAVPGATAET